MCSSLVTDNYRHNTTNEQWEAAQPYLIDPIKHVWWPQKLGDAMAVHISDERWHIDASGVVTQLP